MNIGFIFIILFIGLITLWFLIGSYTARTVYTPLDYFLAGKQIGPWSIMFNLIATQMGGGFLQNTAEHAYTIGYLAASYGLGICSGFLLLSYFIIHRLHAFKLGTIAQLFEVRYGSKTLRKIAASIFIISLFGILLAQIVTVKAILASINIDHIWLLLLFWLPIFIYTSQGGFRSTTIVDFAREIFMLSSFIIIFIIIAYQHPDTIIQFFSVPTTATLFFPISFKQFSEALLLFILPALFCLIEQDILQNFFAARSVKAAQKGGRRVALVLGCMLIIPVFLGITSRLISNHVVVDYPFTFGLTHLAPPTFFILGILALCFAIASTANALLFAISTHIIIDFEISSFKAPLKKQTKMITLIVGVIAVIVAPFLKKTIIELLTESYEFALACLFIPCIVAYSKQKVYKTAAYFSILVGFLSHLFFGFSSVLFRELIVIGLSGIGYIIGYLYSTRSCSFK